MNLSRGQLFRTPNVVDVIGISAINQNVTGLKIRCDGRDHFVHDCGRNHEPNSTRLLQFAHKILHRSGSHGLFFHQFLNGLRRPVEYDALVTSFEKPSHHVRSHSAETNHSELHDSSLHLLASSEHYAEASFAAHHAVVT